MKCFKGMMGTALLFMSVLFVTESSAQQFNGATNTTGAIWRTGEIYIGDYTGSANRNGLFKWHNNSHSVHPNTFGIYTWGDYDNINLGGNFVRFQKENGQPNTVFAKGKIRIGYNSTAWDNWRLRIETDATNTTYQNGLYIDHKHTTGYAHAFRVNVNNDMTNALSIVNSSTGSSVEVVKILGTGKIYATEVQVQLPPFPDYVFKRDYKLLTLPQVESFIKENGHLPNVPSAETVASEGIGLGQLQAISIEKIEELTLYLIEQDKKIKALEAEIEAMKIQTK